MKLHPDISHARRKSGILLMECLMYLAVFVLLLGGAMTVFYFCWDNSKALIYTTDDITAALHAGERWRADVRGATGEISVEVTPGGELLRIPRGKDEVFYSFHDGAIRRKLASSGYTEMVFAKVNASQMKLDARGDVTAWCWELELPERRKEMHLPLRFTFAAAQMKP